MIADLHIHSKYSRATSAQCVPEYLDLWARRKGIGLVGTGDFTHPAWRAELADKLEREAGARGTFLDELVMHEVLSELRDIARRGGVSCECGSTEWKLQVNYSSIDLICAQCGAQMRIPAATADDIDDICCKNTILIRGKK